MTSSQLNPETRADLAQRTLNLLDAGEVVRFHAVPTISGQTVGHHSFGVAAILIALGMMVDPDDRWVVSNAILHDAAELITGDMPFTVKRSNPELKAHMDRMELQADMDHFLPQTRLSHRQETLLKLADMLEGLRWCLVGHERGNHIVAGRWAAAIINLMVDKHQHLADGEGERVWTLFRGCVDLCHDSKYDLGVPVYRTLASQLQAHATLNQPIQKHERPITIFTP